MKSLSIHEPTISAPLPIKRSVAPRISISNEAAEFARARQVLPTLSLIQSWIVNNHAMADSITIELVPDPEIANYSLVTFRVATHATVDEVSEFKEFLDTMLYEQGSIDDQEHFVVLFSYL